MKNVVNWTSYADTYAQYSFNGSNHADLQKTVVALYELRVERIYMKPKINKNEQKHTKFHAARDEPLCSAGRRLSVFTVDNG